MRARSWEIDIDEPESPIAPYRPRPPAPIEFAELEQVRLEQWLLDAAIAHHHRVGSRRVLLTRGAWLGLAGLCVGAIASVPVLAIAGLGVVLASGTLKLWDERGLWARIESAETRGLDPRRICLMPLFSDDRGLRALDRRRKECQAQLLWLTSMLERYGSSS